MPIVAYISMRNKKTKGNKDKGIPSVTQPHFERVKVSVKTVLEAKQVLLRKDFVRYSTGPLTLDELIHRRMSEGRSDWYV